MKNRSKATLLVHGTLGGGISWNDGFQPSLSSGNDDKPAAGSRNSMGALWQGDIFTMMRC